MHYFCDPFIFVGKYFFLYVTSSEAKNTTTNETWPGLGQRCSCLLHHLFKFIQMPLAQPCHYLTYFPLFFTLTPALWIGHTVFAAAFTDFLALKATNRSVALAHGSLNIKAFGKQIVTANGIYDPL